MSFKINLLFSAEIPVDKHFSKKNRKTIGYRGSFKGTVKRVPFIMSDPGTKVIEERLVLLLLQRARLVNFDRPIDFPVHLLCTIQQDNFLTKKSHINLIAGDSTNIVQGVEDSLQKAGIITNDALFVEHTIKRKLGPNHLSIQILSI